jgi:hypothetical protein
MASSLVKEKENMMADETENQADDTTEPSKAADA